MAELSTLHVVPPGGMPTWPEPSFTAPVGPPLDGGLAVEVVERRGEWGRVVCTNGWSAWVDARLLVQTTPRTTAFAAPQDPPPTPTPAIGPDLPTEEAALYTASPTVTAPTLPGPTPAPIPPAPTPPAPPPEPPAPAAAPRRDWRPLRIALGILLLVTSAVVFVTSRGGGGTAAASGIALEGADVPGPQAFTPSVSAPRPTSLASAATTIPAATSSGPARFNAVGDRLYGGTRGAPSCNTAQLISYLEANPTRGRAWASAISVAPTDIRPFVGSLTPVFLRIDTRVTEYRFASGRPQARQSVLQAGTAVLLDRSAFPRVRCASGNPLGQPVTGTGTPRYDGQPWPGFAPSRTAVVTPARQTPALVLYDIGNGGVFVRLPGSIVILDLDPSVAGSALIVVEPGGPFTIIGSRWPAGTVVQLAFDNPAVPLGTATADGAGNFTAAVTAPAGAQPGTHQVTITGAGFQGTQTVYVIPAVPRAR